MKRKGLATKAAMCGAALLMACALPAFAADEFIGDWATVTTVEGTDYPSDMKIWKEDGEIKVSVEDDLNGEMETSNAKIDGDTLTFEILVEALSLDPLEVTLTLKDGALTGTLSSDLGDLPMEATAVGGAGGDITGTWDVIADVQGTDYPVTMTVVDNDGTLEVTIEDDLNGVMPVENVEINGNTLTYDITIDAIGPDAIPGKVMFDGDTFEGALEVADLGEIPLSGTRAGGGIAGVWNVIAEVAGDEYPVVMTIATDGGGVTLTMEDDLNGEMQIDDAKLDGNTISFEVTVDAIGPDPLPVMLTIDGDTFEGVLDASDILGEEIPLTGEKEGAAGGDAEAAILEALDHFKVGMENKDTDEIAMALADDFDHPEFGDKEMMVAFLSDTFAGGDLDDTEIDFSGIEIEVDGDTATAYPAELLAAFGTLTIEFSLENQEGMWKVTTVEVEGL